MIQGGGGCLLRDERLCASLKQNSKPQGGDMTEAQLSFGTEERMTGRLVSIAFGAISLELVFHLVPL